MSRFSIALVVALVLAGLHGAGQLPDFDPLMRLLNADTEIEDLVPSFPD